jgi:hypothetical protein
LEHIASRVRRKAAPLADGSPYQTRCQANVSESVRTDASGVNFEETAAVADTVSQR